MRGTCTVEGCERERHAQQLCSSHYQQARKSGALGTVFEPDPEKRFWSYVQKTDDCWIWIGPVGGGYGSFNVNWTNHRAHRYAYELLVGPIAAGLQIDHLCRRPLCVRPDHLEPVTGRVNRLRGTSFVAVNAAKTHCCNGHEFSPENTYVDKRGRRGCRTCRLNASTRHRRRDAVAI